MDVMEAEGFYLFVVYLNRNRDHLVAGPNFHIAHPVIQRMIWITPQHVSVNAIWRVREDRDGIRMRMSKPQVAPRSNVLIYVMNTILKVAVVSFAFTKSPIRKNSHEAHGLSGPSGSLRGPHDPLDAAGSE
jgi:hypothetical protein